MHVDTQEALSRDGIYRLAIVFYDHGKLQDGRSYNSSDRGCDARFTSQPPADEVLENIRNLDLRVTLANPSRYYNPSKGTYSQGPHCLFRIVRLVARSIMQLNFTQEWKADLVSHL